ncbi:MAG: hypothetical protein GC204_05235 [Chloroflexi bacterium]|nr:hypothetical protein [Chloroflexota bacterium]
MAHQVNWYMGRRIVYVQIQGQYLSLGDMQAINEQLLPFIRHSDGPYAHVIIDASSVTQLQSHLPDPMLSYLREPDLGWSILIASDAVIRQLKPLFARTRCFESFTSPEEGLFFLQDEDLSLLMPA